MGEIGFRPAKPEEVNILYEVKIAAYADEFRQFGYSEYKNEEGDEDCRMFCRNT